MLISVYTFLKNYHNYNFVIHEFSHTNFPNIT